MTEKGLVLVSDGIDSPVAMHIMIKKGFIVDGIHFSIGSEETTDKVKRLIRAASGEARTPRLYLIDFKTVQEEIRKKCYTRFQCILCKRLMHRIAEAVAQRDGYSFLVNGENLGQVASQTLENMYTIHHGLSIKVVQPILTRDKNETVEIAKSIGTYLISTASAAKCPYLPPNPLTRSTPYKIGKEEEALDIPKMIRSALKSTKILA